MKFLTFFLVLISVRFTSVADETYPCFSISQATPHSHRVPHSLKVQTQSYRRTNLGGLQFRASGKTSSQISWRIPLKISIPTRFDVSFTVESVNLKAPGNRPNLYILLVPTTEASRMLPKKIPVFTTTGVDGKELGSTQFVNTDGYSVDSLIVDMILGRDGDAALEIGSFSLSYKGNLIPNSASRETLANWPEAPRQFKKRPLKPFELTDKTTRYTLDGIDFGENPQPALLNRLVSKSGFQFNHVSIPLGGERSLWSHPGYFNFDRLTSLIERSSQPGTPVVINVILTQPPSWWRGLGTDSHDRSVSDFNPRWQAYCQDALQQLLAGIANAGLNERVCGFILDLSPHRNAGPLTGRTRHPAVTRRFREWLKDQYFDDTELKTSWKQPNASFASSAWIPMARWPRGLLGPLAPSPNQILIDSQMFYFESWDNFATGLNGYIKELTGGNALCGFWLHPNRTTSLWNNSYRSTGSLDDVLKSEEIDFIECPFWEPDFLPTFMSTPTKPVVVRVNLSGMSEKTDVMDYLRLCCYSSLGQVDGVVIETERPFALTHDDCVKELKMTRAARSLGDAGNRDDVQLAFVIDPQVFQNLAPVRNQPILSGTGARPVRNSRKGAPMHYLYEMAQRLWPYSGVPYDIISIDDLDPQTSYRTLCFFHCITLSKERIKRIDAMKKKGRTLIWSWADGLMASGKFNASALKDITGIQVKFSARKQRLFMTATKEMKDFLDDRSLETTPGGIVSPYETDDATRRIFLPSFEIADDDVDVLAVNIDSRKPALGIREFFRWNSLYSSSPAINPEIIRAGVLKSDAHVYYHHNDPIRLDSNIVVLYARSSGLRTLEFPEDTPLYDVFEDNDMPAAETHTFHVKKGKTHLFYRGCKADWKNIISR